MIKGEMKMKKFLAVLLALTMLLSLAACVKTSEVVKDPEPAAEPETPAEPVEEPQEEEPQDEVMSYADYVAADLDTPVTVDCYVQAHQSWWDGKITVYAADEDGAYFLYNMACSEEDAKLFDVAGQGIRVTGYKSEWSGEIEIIDATFTLLDETYEAVAMDATELLGTDELIAHQNERVSFTGMTVEPANDKGAAFLYSWDGSGSYEGNSDLYFYASKDGVTYSFTVESYLCGNDTEVYNTVANLKVGQVIDMEGFLYWYNGSQPHVTMVKSIDGVMTHAGYMAAELDTEVTVDCFVQAHQSWWDGKITVYAADANGAYFLYNLACAEKDAKLFDKVGQGIRVTGYKSEWSGEIEITDATYTVLKTTYEAPAVDVTELLGTEELIAHQNEKVSFTGMTVEAANDEGAAFLYSWDGSGSHEANSDLYFNVSYNGETYTFTVESYLCGNNSEVYTAVENLQVGDVINMEGFLYWYNGVNPHITFVIEK